MKCSYKACNRKSHRIYDSEGMVESHGYCYHLECWRYYKAVKLHRRNYALL